MNNEAKRMMLLAMLDGTIDELPEMRNLIPEMNSVVCAHSSVNSPIESPLESNIESPFKTEYVVLNRAGFEGTTIGWAARCSICKRIYYRLEHPNLCDTCTYSIPTCIPVKIEFGDGIGNDNVIKCDTHKVKPKTIE